MICNVDCHLCRIITHNLYQEKCVLINGIHFGGVIKILEKYASNWQKLQNLAASINCFIASFGFCRIFDARFLGRIVGWQQHVALDKTTILLSVQNKYTLDSKPANFWHGWVYIKHFSIKIKDYSKSHGPMLYYWVNSVKTKYNNNTSTSEII